MQGIIDTKNSMIQFVYPEHANNLGTLHGGRLMDWIMLIGTITSSRFSKSTTLLGATDSIDFINPVKVGDIVMLDSWIEYVGSSSMEIVVRVYSENIESGEKKFITLSHLAFVAIGDNGKPQEIQKEIIPQFKNEELIIENAKKRREIRLPEIKKRKEKVLNAVDETEITRFNLQTTRSVMPEDAFYGNYMSVGKLLKYIDESAGILAMRYARGVLVTGSMDNLFFYTPIRVGEVVILNAGITYIGSTSIEIAIKVDAEDMETGVLKHTCTAFLTFVHIDDKGNPLPVPKFKPETPYEIREWKEAELRKNIRRKRLGDIKLLADDYLNDYKNAVTVSKI
ncbi:MAG: acyl-CoA thioesterase [Thermodesulfobacteriota bacterium]